MTEFSIKHKLQELADALDQEPGDCDCEYSPPLTPDVLAADFPIFTQLNREELLSLIGAIAFWLSHNAELIPWNWEKLGIPLEAEMATEQLSEEQLQQCLLPYLTSRLQVLPIPCRCCGGEGREPESGFCAKCDRLLNSPAVAQVCGSWDDGDPEHRNGISNY